MIVESEIDLAWGAKMVSTVESGNNGEKKVETLENGRNKGG